MVNSGPYDKSMSALGSVDFTRDEIADGYYIVTVYDNQSNY